MESEDDSENKQLPTINGDGIDNASTGSHQQHSTNREDAASTHSLDSSLDSPSDVSKISNEADEFDDNSDSDENSDGSSWFQDFEEQCGFIFNDDDDEDEMKLINQLNLINEYGNPNWTWLELAALRDPLVVAEWRGISEIHGYEQRALWMIIEYDPPISVLHCFLRADPDAVLEIVEQDGHDMTLLSRAVYSDCADIVVENLSRATAHAYGHYELEGTPIDFLLEEFPTDEEKLDFSTLAVLLESISLVPAFHFYSKFSACDFLLRWITRPGRVHPILIKTPSASETVISIFAKMLEFDTKLGDLLSSDRMYFQKLFSREWPLGLPGCSVIVAGLLQNYEYPTRLAVAFYDGRLPLHLAINNFWPYNCIEKILEAHLAAIQIKDTQTGLYPFQMAARNLSECATPEERQVENYLRIIMKGYEPEKFDLLRLDTCYRLLREDPSVCRKRSVEKKMKRVETLDDH